MIISAIFKARQTQRFSFNREYKVLLLFVLSCRGHDQKLNSLVT